MEIQDFIQSAVNKVKAEKKAIEDRRMEREAENQELDADALYCIGELRQHLKDNLPQVIFDGVHFPATADENDETQEMHRVRVEIPGLVPMYLLNVFLPKEAFRYQVFSVYMPLMGKVKLHYSRYEPELDQDHAVALAAERWQEYIGKLAEFTHNLEVQEQMHNARIANQDRKAELRKRAAYLQSANMADGETYCNPSMIEIMRLEAIAIHLGRIADALEED